LLRKVLARFCQLSARASVLRIISGGSQFFMEVMPDELANYQSDILVCHSHESVNLLADLAEDKHLDTNMFLDYRFHENEKFSRLHHA